MLASMICKKEREMEKRKEKNQEKKC